MNHYRIVYTNRLNTINYIEEFVNIKEAKNRLEVILTLEDAYNVQEFIVRETDKGEIIFIS